MFKLIDFSKHSSPILKIPINIYGARYEVRVFHEDENCQIRFLKELKISLSNS